MKLSIQLSVSCVYLMCLFLFACNEIGHQKSDEGYIEYSATPVDLSNPKANFAPTKMIIKFKGEKAAAEMAAGMGLFTNAYISNFQQKTMSQLVKIVNKKYLVTLDSVAVKKEIMEESSGMIVTKTKKTKTIAGYKCKHARVNFKDDSKEGFDIFYTTDIKIPHANWSNPFQSIDGVLMEYQLSKYGLEMKFVATAVKKTPIEDATFEISKDYKPISQQEMENIFNDF